MLQAANLPTGMRALLKPAVIWIRSLQRAVHGAAKSVRSGSRRTVRACLARLRRPQLRQVTFIGVTGSCGKTTTAQLIGAVLSLRGKAHVSSGLNGYTQIVDSVLGLDASTQYCVQELSGSWPGRMAPQVQLLRPAIGVVTTIGTDHYKSFRSKEATAQEKGQLIERLPEHATAIINADDPLVLAMRDRTRARVLTIGRSVDSDLRAIDVSSVWPERLRLTVAHGQQSIALNTQLVGEWWTTSVLVGMACGLVCGLDLKSCAVAIEAFEPVMGRWSVHHVPGGATFIFDQKAPLGTIGDSLAFVAAAHAKRKTVVLGTISDYPGAAGARYRKIAREALAVADRVIFAGPHAGHAAKIAQGPYRERLLSFDTTYQASEFLKSETVPGELILIKGSLRVDHLERIIFSQLDQIICWKNGCGVEVPCPRCKRYRRPFPPAAYSVRSDPLPEQHLATDSQDSAGLLS